MSIGEPVKVLEMLTSRREIVRFEVSATDALTLFMNKTLETLEPIKALCIEDASNALGLCAESEIARISDADIKRLVSILPTSALLSGMLMFALSKKNIHRVHFSLTQALQPIEPPEDCVYVEECNGRLTTRYKRCLARLSQTTIAGLGLLIISEMDKAGGATDICADCRSELMGRIPAVKCILLDDLNRFRP